MNAEGVKPGEPETPAPVTPWGMVSQFFVIPLVIVLICAGLFAGIRWITSEQSSPLELLREIRSGSETRRGQAAYQLALLLRSGGPAAETIRKDPQFVPELLRIYRQAREAPPEIRRYLTAVLAVLGDVRSLPELLEALKDTDAETRGSAVTALGGIGDPAAIGPILERLKDDKDRGVRLFSAFVLGKFESAAIVPALRAALDDEADDVRWNAALALAVKGDRAAAPVLERMLYRAYLKGVRVPGMIEESGLLTSREAPQGEMSDERVEETILNALRAIDKLGAKETFGAVEKLASADKSERVRKAAAEISKKLQGSSK